MDKVEEMPTKTNAQVMHAVKPAIFKYTSTQTITSSRLHSGHESVELVLVLQQQQPTWHGMAWHHESMSRGW